MKSIELLGKDVAGVNQILPHVHVPVWDMFIKGCANNWMPTEVSMAKDIEQWKSKTVLSDAERLVVKRCMGFFAGSESLVGNNLLLSVFKYVTDAECRQYILRQAFEESLHNLTVVYVCDSLGLSIDEVFEAYNNIPSIKAKDDFLMEITSDLSRGDFNTQTIEGKREFLRNLITYYIVCEGTFFFSGFAMLLGFGRQNKLPGISEQISYTLRDEVIHIQFGTYLINKIREQNPSVWTDGFERETVEHVKKAVELEVSYANDVLPDGILGMNAGMFVDYMQHIANARLDAIGIPGVFPDTTNPFKWLDETIFLKKQVNFFEKRVTEYQTGTLKDDF